MSVLFLINSQSYLRLTHHVKIKLVVGFLTTYTDGIAKMVESMNKPQYIYNDSVSTK